ncbi:MAG: hypothetical protein IJV17_00510 [Prevotella sp.]|nr:hypothetical protein [Prevotella sp.]
MKKTYIKPESEMILLESIQLLTGSAPGAGDQSDPGMGSREIDFDDEKLLFGDSPFIGY